jgi:hypothetical protein
MCLALATVWAWGWDYYSCVPSRERRAVLRLAVAGGLLAGLAIPSAWQLLGLEPPRPLAEATLAQRLLVLHPGFTLASGVLAGGVALLLLRAKPGEP